MMIDTQVAYQIVNDLTRQLVDVFWYIAEILFRVDVNNMTQPGFHDIGLR